MIPDIHLIAFLEEWLQWVEYGENGPYYSDEGLCDSLERYFYSQDTYDWNAHNDSLDKLHELLDRDFGTHRFPFGGQEQFYKEIREESCHLNQERVQWASRILNELKEEV